MKKTTITLLLLALTSPVFAEAPAATVGSINLSGTLPTRTAPLATATSAGTPSSAAVKPGQLVNPFNGKPLSAEQIQRELESARLQTQMLEEQLKQTNLSEELKNVPLRKSVEAAQARTAVKKEEFLQKDIETQAKTPKAPQLPPASMAAPAGAAAHAAPAKKAGKSSAGAKSASVEAKPEKSDKLEKKEPVTKDNEKKDREKETQASRPAPRPVLVSIITVGAQSSAVFEVAGSTAIVRDGEMSPFGPVKILDESSANVGGNVLKVHQATLSRFVNSDPKPIAPGPQGSGSAPFAPSAVQNPAVGGLPAQANGPLPALPLPPATTAPSANAKASLPSLQLPPGVNVLPAPR